MNRDVMPEKTEARFLTKEEIMEDLSVQLRKNKIAKTSTRLC